MNSHGFIFALLLFILAFDCSTSDLSLFPKDIRNSDSPEYVDKLRLFSEQTPCPEPKECANELLTIEKEVFCHDFCQEKVSLEKESCQMHNSMLKNAQAKSNQEYEAQKRKILNVEGLLIYYRKFVHTFLDHLSHEEINADSLDFRINIFMTQHQINRLRLFSDAINDSDAGVLIQETTDILNNMFRFVKYEKPEEYLESFSKSFVSVLLDSRIQITLFALITFTIIFTILFRQIARFKFSIKTLVLILLVLAFVVSIVNNHLLLIQKKQILKQQMLKESIPEECFLSGIVKVDPKVTFSFNELNHEFWGFPASIDKKPENSGYLNSAFSYVKSYFKHKPTSQKCLDYHEALLVDAKQANFIETILFTITESFRPVSVLFGESINQFYSSLTKNLSFYQYIPLTIFVTSILVPILIFMMSFLSLLLFDYEFNFFHLISLRKNKKSAENPPVPQSAPAIQQSDLLKIIDILKRENDQLQAAKPMTASIANFETLKPVPSEKLAIEPTKQDESKIDLNESLTLNVESLIQNKKQREQELLKKIENLEREKNKLKELVINQSKEKLKDNTANSSSSFLDSTSDESDTTNQNKKIETLSPSKPTLFSSTIRHEDDMNKSNFEKSLTDNNFDDDEEDIVVILDE